MEALILLNYILFAAVFTLLSLELGGALVSVLDPGLFKRKIITYLSPLWEITGTFGVFYLVNLVATYPDLIQSLDYIYLPLVLFAVVFLIARDTYLAYSELNEERREIRKQALIYATFTLLFMIALISILSSSVSGEGVNALQPSANLLFLLFNSFNLLMVCAIMSLALTAAILFFRLGHPKILVSMALLSALSLTIALKAYVPYMVGRVIEAPAVLVPVAVLFIGIAIMYLTKNRYTRFLVAPFIFIGTLTFEFLQYPYVFGGAINLNNVIAPQPTSYYILVFTLIGGGFLTAAMTLFFYINHSKKKK